MTHDQRTALARIISDMIRADNIIEESEIRDMKSFISRYSITQTEMSDARNMRFSEAITILQELSLKERHDVFDCIYKMALSDNICVPKEVLLLMALKYCLVGGDRSVGSSKLQKPYLISCPTGESSMNDQYMVYLESDYDEQLNNEIQKNFELLVTRAHINGFNFVYIPKMVEEFKGMDSQYVRDVISYMAPQLSENVVSDVYNRLCNLTTSEFFHNVLYEKLQVKAIYDATPSLLINIGTSVVPYCNVDGAVQYYTEFLCIPLTCDPLALVKELLDFYKEKVSLRTITINDNQGQFKYFGFYKALFDFLIAPPPVVPDLIFMGQELKSGKYHIAFRFEHDRERIVYLTPKRYDLYMRIAEKSYKRPCKGLPVSQIDNTSLSHLRRTLADNLKDISFVEQYKPEKTGNVCKLRLDKNKVFIKRMDMMHENGYRIIPITET